MPAVLARVTLLLAMTVGARAPASLDVTHTARALQPGEVITLRVTASVPLRSVAARVAGRSLVFWPADTTHERWLALAGIDVETEAGAQVFAVEAVATSGESIRTSHTIDIAPKTFASRHLRVDPRYSDPPENVRPRIASEAARLEALFGAVSRASTPDVPLTAPVPQTPNSRFGARSFFNRQLRGRHNGVDFPSPAGTAIHAPGHGRIVLVDDLYFTGHTVVIDHGYGLYTLFAHLERTAATVGADVQRGDVVGFVGATGRATGPHLHWSMRLLGARVDPLSLTKLSTSYKLDR
jgi:murein DD-endopeptidase MepM/ murein hydrolase activator NlpD